MGAGLPKGTFRQFCPNVLQRVYSTLVVQVSMKRPLIDVTEKTAIYHTLYQLNSAFAAIVGLCQTLQQSGVFSSQYARLFQGFAQELQAEINVEILEIMDGIETEDWRRFGKVRDRREKFLKGPKAKR
jgi:hypothetical protein